MIRTLLGASVGACIRGSERQIGGVNDVEFRQYNANAAEVFAPGANGMELLTHGPSKRGADRRRLQAKVFGSTKMMPGSAGNDPRNGRCLLAHLASEGIAHCGRGLGRQRATRAQFLTGDHQARTDFFTEATRVCPAIAPPPTVRMYLSLPPRDSPRCAAWQD